MQFPNVYTSYDYAAGIAENRSIRNKHREYALTGGFWSAFPAFIGADRVSAGAGNDVASSNKPVYTAKFSATDGSSQTFYVARQQDSTSFQLAAYKMNVTTDRGARTIPVTGNFTLVGRDSRLIAINGKLPSSTLLYSSASASFARSIDGTDVVVLHSDAGHPQEAVFALNAGASDTFTAQVYDYTGALSTRAATIDTSKPGEVQINWTKGTDSTTRVVLQSGNVKILALLTDTVKAYKTYAPPIAIKGTIGHYAGLSELALVSGTYLVKNATIDNDTLALYGAANISSSLDIVTRSAVTKVSWNGAMLNTKKSPWGSLVATVPGPSSAATSLTAPGLTGWKYADSLPEASATFDDSKWTVAGLTSSNNEYFQDPLVQTEGKVLFADAYGHHANNIVWRGHFSAGSTPPTGIYFRYEGGKYSAGSLFLNSVFLGSLHADNYSDDFANFTFPAGALKTGGANVITFLHDNTGLEEDGGFAPIGFRTYESDNDSKLNLQSLKMPRGIIAYNWLGSTTTKMDEWRVQGNFKGEDAPDRVRTYINEGGLYGEVQGWHLPGFDDSKWTSGSPTDGLSTAGVGFYRTTFNLNVPAGHDIPISVRFSEDKGSDYRALLYINGWQFGRRFTRYGPQTSFVVPPGVLNTQGSNTIAVSLWNPTNLKQAVGSLSLNIDGVYTGDIEQTLHNPTFSELR